MSKSDHVPEKEKYAKILEKKQGGQMIGRGGTFETIYRGPVAPLGFTVNQLEMTCPASRKYLKEMLDMQINEKSTIAY